MNRHLSTNDFRYLDVTHSGERLQIERELLEMGTSPEVIDWFFTVIDGLRADYSKVLRAVGRPR